MITGDTTFFDGVVSGDICVSVCYDGVVSVDGHEVFNIFEMTKEINEAILKGIDELNRR